MKDIIWRAAAETEIRRHRGDWTISWTLKENWFSIWEYSRTYQTNKLLTNLMLVSVFEMFAKLPTINPSTEDDHTANEYEPMRSESIDSVDNTTCCCFSFPRGSWIAGEICSSELTPRPKYFLSMLLALVWSSSSSSSSVFVPADSRTCVDWKFL